MYVCVLYNGVHVAEAVCVSIFFPWPLSVLLGFQGCNGVCQCVIKCVCVCVCQPLCNWAHLCVCFSLSEIHYCFCNI